MESQTRYPEKAKIGVDNEAECSDMDAESEKMTEKKVLTKVEA